MNTKWLHFYCEEDYTLDFIISEEGGLYIVSSKNLVRYRPETVGTLILKDNKEIILYLFGTSKHYENELIRLLTLHKLSGNFNTRKDIRYSQ